MADNENETTAPEAAEESQPQVPADDQPNNAAVELENEGQDETQADEKPPSPEVKDDLEKTDEVQAETAEVKDGEEATKPEGDGEDKEQEAGEAEKIEGGEGNAEGEEPSAPDTNAEPSEGVETTDAQPEATEAAEETDAKDGAEESNGAVQDGDNGTVQGDEAVEGEDSTAQEQSAEGEADVSEAPKGETEDQNEEVKQDTTEEEADADEAEKKPDDETEEAAEIEKGPEIIAEDGDRETSPVGEKLSREATPDAIDHSEMERERLEATTPNKIDEADEAEYELREEDEERMEDEDEDEEDVEEPAFKREELIEKYYEALAVREQLQQKNYALQHKLAEYFRKKKADERQDYDKNVTDQEQRYLKYMAQLEDLRRQYMMEKDNFRVQIEDSKDRCQDKKEKVDFERKKFMEFKKQVALNAVNSRSGKPIPPKDIEQYLVNEVKKEQEVVNVRLENIKLKNKLKKKEQQLKSKEELAEGLHLIDFEQLKIENQTYNEKIEERNEELLKLRKKITSTVQVLTHLKEKLQFVQGENLEKSKLLKDVEGSLAQARDVLSRTKQARDALRIDNQKLRQNCGLLGNELLLRDFEERKDEGDDLRGQLEELKMRHAELTLQCNQVRRKIEQARQGMA